MSYGQTPTIKRVRGKNFTDNERDEVLKIIDKYKNIIDNKKTDAETIRLKNAAWQEVTEEFNSILPMSRTPSQLRVFYENYKVKLRKELVEQGLKTDADEVSIKRMKLTDSEEKLIVKYQKPMPSNSHVEYIDRYNNIEAGTSNTLHYGRDKVFFDNNSQSFYPEPTVSSSYVTKTGREVNRIHGMCNFKETLFLRTPCFLKIIFNVLFRFTHIVF